MDRESHEQTNNFITAGTMAERLGVPIHKVQYILRTRQIEPAGKAGVLRVYSEEQLAEVAANLDAISARQGGAA